ncbi:MAG: TRAM domain-containing protein, partial [Chromatiaceae bacterium]|nr:TRAM domain-containing protein [Chromatiaceae bacterium]
VGFPGETEEDFAATLSLVDEIEFDSSFSFIYSRRPGTPAADYPDKVPHEVKQSRLSRLQERLHHHAQVKSRRMVGTAQQVLVEGSSRRNTSELAGRTANNRMVNFAGPQNLIGDFADLIVTRALPNSLRGELTSRGMHLTPRLDPYNRDRQ